MVLRIAFWWSISRPVIHLDPPVVVVVEIGRTTDDALANPGSHVVSRLECTTRTLQTPTISSHKSLFRPRVAGRGRNGGVWGVNFGGSREVDLGAVVRSAANNKYVGHAR